MILDLKDLLIHYRKLIIDEWVRRLKSEVSKQYNQRPVNELYHTVTEAFDANYAVIVQDDFLPINDFITKITKMRLEAGFNLSDVQKAFELYRTILTPLILAHLTGEHLRHALSKLNNCLAYTIHRFSDYFQKMHEMAMVRHNKELEYRLKLKTIEMRESELKYMTLVEEINEGYFIIRNETIVFANNAFFNMHGYTQSEAIGKPFWIFVSPESREQVMEIYRNAVLGKQAPRIFEYMRLTKDGRSFPTEITAKVRRGKEGIENIGICRDITWRVELQKKTIEAEQLGYIAQVATSLSHELRNPLSSVKLNLQILSKSPNIVGNDKKRVEISVSELIRLENVLSELLEFSKPLEVKLVQCNINDLIGSCLELMEPRFEEKGILPVLETDPGLPKIHIDPEKMTQVFVNIFNNAIEAVNNGGMVIVTTTEREEEGLRFVDITIEDNGPGIPQNMLKEIFKPFFTTKSKGTGLGLSIVKRIVEAHNGTVHAQLRYPKGATFVISLPIGEESA
ncbi:MAG: ATP-binding protein [Desulfatiglandales bacterium]